MKVIKHVSGLKIFNMIQIEKITKQDNPTLAQIESLTNFLYTHLEQYGDSKADIQKAIQYALGVDDKPGGFILVAKNDSKAITGIVVVLNTLMQDFIPEHILVYIATDANLRGQGIGKQLMQDTIVNCSGSIALHVEPDNPAKILYEKLGFENKYLEMRLSK